MSTRERHCKSSSKRDVSGTGNSGFGRARRTQGSGEDGDAIIRHSVKTSMVEFIVGAWVRLQLDINNNGYVEGESILDQVRGQAQGIDGNYRVITVISSW